MTKFLLVILLGKGQVEKLLLILQLWPKFAPRKGLHFSFFYPKVLLISYRVPKKKPEQKNEIIVDNAIEWHQIFAFILKIRAPNRIRLYDEFRRRYCSMVFCRSAVTVFRSPGLIRWKNTTLSMFGPPRLTKLHRQTFQLFVSRLP